MPSEIATRIAERIRGEAILPSGLHASWTAAIIDAELEPTRVALESVKISVYGSTDGSGRSGLLGNGHIAVANCRMVKNFYLDPNCKIPDEMSKAISLILDNHRLAVLISGAAEAALAALEVK